MTIKKLAFIKVSYTDSLELFIPALKKFNLKNHGKGLNINFFLLLYPYIYMYFQTTAKTTAIPCLVYDRKEQPAQY